MSEYAGVPVLRLGESLTGPDGYNCWVVVYVEGALRSGQIREASRMRRRENKIRNIYCKISALSSCVDVAKGHTQHDEW